jgi:hypothetical protein
MHRTAWSSDEPDPADRLAMLPSFWRNAIARKPPAKQARIQDGLRGARGEIVGGGGVELIAGSGRREARTSKSNGRGGARGRGGGGRTGTVMAATRVGGGVLGFGGKGGEGNGRRQL